MVKVSVIMPVYNSQEYLPACLNSVLKQSLKDIEVICVDDGSTDRSPQILKKYEMTDPRVRVIRQQNRYAGAARNRGLEEAVGTYVVFWDSDDLFDREALEKLYQKCEQDQADVAICRARRLDNASGEIYSSGIYLVRKRLPKAVPFDKANAGKYLFNITTNVPWNKMYRREFILEKQLAFQEIRQANDTYFTMLALFYAKRITVVDRCLVTYREGNPKSLTGKASDSRFCILDAYRAVYQVLQKDPGFNEELRQSFANKALDSLLYSLRTQWNVQSFKELFDTYKADAFEEFGILHQEKDYFYSEEQADDLEQMMAWDAEQFLLYLFRKYERQYQLLNGNYLVRGQRFLKKAGNRISGKQIRR